MMEVIDFIRRALECSIYVAPREHGLTTGELVEVGSCCGFQRGEILDSVGRVAEPAEWNPERMRLREVETQRLSNFICEWEPDFRNPGAFQFVDEYLRELARSEGKTKARVQRNVLVAHGSAAGFSDHDMEVAVSVYVLAGTLLQRDGYLSLASGRDSYLLPKAQIGQRTGDTRQDRPGFLQTYEAVKDVIGRRTGGRASSAEPISSFEAALEELGHGRFRLWWAQIASEFRRASSDHLTTGTCVLAASLAEGALTFVVDRARNLKLATLSSKTFAESETRWKFDELARSAASGGKDAILDQNLRGRAERLNAMRNRIHPGRFLAEIPTGPIPDIRPDDAREAVETANAIVRAVLDWLERHPASQDQ